MEYFSAEGLGKSVCEELTGIGIEDMQSANMVLDFLLDNHVFLDESESISYSSVYQDVPQGALSLTSPEKNYYVNVKIITIAVAAMILDVVLTKGVVSGILAIGGFSGTSILRLDEKSGEKCIVKETLLHNGKRGRKDVLSRHAGECCNNDLNCKFRNDDKCACSEKDVIAIYQRLADKNMFKRAGDCFEYQW